MTPAGMSFISQVRTSLYDLHTAIERARAEGTAATGRLRIGIIASLSRGPLRRVLQAFIDAHEHVELVASRLFRTFAQTTTAPWASFSAAWSGAMFMYLRVDHWVPAMCRSLAAARFRQD